MQNPHNFNVICSCGFEMLEHNQFVDAASNLGVDLEILYQMDRYEAQSHEIDEDAIPTTVAICARSEGTYLSIAQLRFLIDVVCPRIKGQDFIVIGFFGPHATIDDAPALAINSNSVSAGIFGDLKKLARVELDLFMLEVALSQA
ncbi:hypothetical protein IB223_17805 [Pseudoxanthomonas sp. PXM03]|uniref:hypothetical protein n=1 Tax=Pseudoxanthomonas sp. PXM03 TaxID=2769284 RepID=UPI001786E11B|nr:hypothetical protein [Pseudoxanthomonas sp. PXM03]MBD9437958.1 hypothetical protein [Pseudoxanthomonas sp. PXM03]